MSYEGVLQMHGFYASEAEKRISFDVVLDFSVPDRQQLYGQIVSETQAMYPDYSITVTLDRDLSD